jgi:uncharacterized protein involved in exopolysaccharide biosynthesis
LRESLVTFDWMRAMQTPDLADAYGADTRRANRRRLRVFLAVFLVTAVAGLIWDFWRPAEYRATARLQITPPSMTLPAAAEGKAGDGNQPFLTEVQTLTSRPLVEQVAERLRSAGHDLSTLGLDPILGLQSTMIVTPIEGTQIVELAAIGRQPELPAALLVGISEVYREHVAQAYVGAAAEALARADEEVAKLEESVAAKRDAVEDFRVRNNIVSPEREENNILAEMQGLAAAQKDANKRLTEAEGRLDSLRAAAAEGKGVVWARDNPTLASLEQRASQLREELRELSRRFTQDYLDFDPNARALRTRLAELEEQIKVQRKVGQSNALEEAEQELAAARQSARRLQEQIASGRQKVGLFAARFSQYKSLQEELAQLEKTYQEAQQRQARLNATERSRMPSVQILEQAVIPKEPWRPLYWRDAGIIVAGALLLALAAMWLVELFNRSEPKPSVVVTQPVFAGTLTHSAQPSMTLDHSPQGALSVDPTRRLTQAQVMPRELTVAECTALLRAADRETQRALALLLSGLSPAEALAARLGDVDRAASTLRINSTPPRSIPLGASALQLLVAEDADPESMLVRSPDGAAATADSLSAQLLYCAHDAGVDAAHEITLDAVRHTYVAFLVRQGARFADITRWVGALPADALSAYSQLAPPGQRLEPAAVQTIFPALAPSEGA